MDARDTPGGIVFATTYGTGDPARTRFWWACNCGAEFPAREMRHGERRFGIATRAAAQDSLAAHRGTSECADS